MVVSGRTYVPLVGRAASLMARRPRVQAGKSCARQAAPAVSSPQGLHHHIHMHIYHSNDDKLNRQYFYLSLSNSTIQHKPKKRLYEHTLNLQRTKVHTLHTLVAS